MPIKTLSDRKHAHYQEFLEQHQSKIKVDYTVYNASSAKWFEID